MGENATACGHALGSFVLDNNLDGADVDWEDNTAMNKGEGEAWLVEFTRAVRSVIPNHILSHAPQAPYFKSEHYRNGAYITVHQQVGHLIDFYMVQFYNQVDTRYDSFEELFLHATGPDFSGTAVKEIAARGIPLKKLVVGKPILPSDASNTGYVPQEKLGKWAEQAYDELGWFAGIGHWQYPSDLSGKAIADSAAPLIQKCVIHKNCH
jgi:chitinase